MAPAGYSGTPLPKKLGIKDGAHVFLEGAPAEFDRELVPLPEGVTLVRRASRSARFDVIVFFATDRAALSKRLAELVGRLEPDGGLWIAWPKKSSGVATDLTDAHVRAAGLATGLVDNKVCAITAVWSGLRFVVRLENRPKSPPRARRPKA